MLQQIKKQFLIYRNGIIADSLRKAGFPHKIIFGLQLPQISSIAQSLVPSMELADALWEDDEVRESRLLACYLFPTEEVDMEKALKLSKNVRTPEEADILAFRLLRKLTFARTLKELLMNESPDSYIIKALERFEDN